MKGCTSLTLLIWGQIYGNFRRLASIKIGNSDPCEGFSCRFALKNFENPLLLLKLPLGQANILNVEIEGYFSHFINGIESLLIPINLELTSQFLESMLDPWEVVSEDASSHKLVFDKE